MLLIRKINKNSIIGNINNIKTNNNISNIKNNKIKYNNNKYINKYIIVKQGVEPETQTKRGNQSGNTCIKQNNQTPFLEGA